MKVEFVSRKAIKNFLIKNNLKKYECEICKNKGEWQGKKLSLQLDHINGKNEDNHIDNLRFICPNCHSQTKTFAGRNKGKKRIFIRPSKKELMTLLEKFTIKQISILKAVALRTVYQWLDHYELTVNDYKRKLKCDQVLLIKDLYKSSKKQTQRSLANDFGVSKRLIQNILENKYYCDC